MASIVCTDVYIGRECNSYLREQHFPPETFLPIANLRIKPIRIKQLSGVGLLFDVISVPNNDSNIKRALQFVCGNSLVCDTPEQAREIAYGIVGERYRAVALDGTEFQPSGVVSGCTSELVEKAKKWDENGAIRKMEDRRNQLQGELRNLHNKAMEMVEMRQIEQRKARLKLSLYEERKNVESKKDSIDILNEDRDNLVNRQTENEQQLLKRDVAETKEMNRKLRKIVAQQGERVKKMEDQIAVLIKESKDLKKEVENNQESLLAQFNQSQNEAGEIRQLAEKVEGRGHMAKMDTGKNINIAGILEENNEDDEIIWEEGEEEVAIVGEVNHKWLQAMKNESKEPRKVVVSIEEEEEEEEDAAARKRHPIQQQQFFGQTKKGEEEEAMEQRPTTSGHQIPLQQPRIWENNVSSNKEKMLLRERKTQPEDGPPHVKKGKQ